MQSDIAPRGLAICCVYVVPDGLEWLVGLHLHQLRITTHGPYRIFAAARRASDKALALLDGAPEVTVLDLPETQARGSREHAHYLQALMEHAVAQGFALIASFDADSFPIRAGWNTRLARNLTTQEPFTAVCRAENGDPALPHPSGILCRADFLLEARPDLLPRRRVYFRHLVFVLRYRQRRDVGIGLALAAWAHGVRWHKLVRTNQHDLHRVMAGLYGHEIYHLGAMSHHPVFEADWNETFWRRVLKLTWKLPVLTASRTRHDQQILARNHQIRNKIIGAMQADFPALVALLEPELDLMQGRGPDTGQDRG